jgi:hypothetical protein
MYRLCTAILALALCGVASVQATSYEAVTFNELITQSDVIFIGNVADVRPFSMQTREGPIVKTRVTFRVSDPLLGTTSAVEVFDFLGGEADGMGMAIAGMPKFAVGDQRVVFARRDGSINPIVGFRQGLLQVSRDAAGTDRVMTLEGVPLARVDSIGAPSSAGTVTRAQAMPLSDLRARIVGALAAVGKK